LSCADFCWDGRNPAKSMLPERELQRLTPESGVCLEGTTTRVRMNCARLLRIVD
jgi:hypothetical protein